MLDYGTIIEFDTVCTDTHHTKTHIDTIMAMFYICIEAFFQCRLKKQKATKKHAGMLRRYDRRGVQNTFDTMYHYKQYVPKYKHSNLYTKYSIKRCIFRDEGVCIESSILRYDAQHFSFFLFSYLVAVHIFRFV